MMNLRRAFFSIATLTMVAGFSLPALADEATHRKAGVPQFDPSSFTGQLFWLALTFALLYILMAKLALPRIGRVVESRAGAIAADLARAQADRGAAAAVLATYESKLAAARTESQNLIAQAQQSASQTQTIALSAQGNKISGDIHAAEQRIVAAKHQALNQIAPAAAAATAAMLQKVAGLTVDASKIDAAVAAALKDKAA